MHTQVKHKEKKMPGIVVGIDGSTHSRRALAWAVREAAIRHAPLTVLTVQQAMTSFWAGPMIYPADAELAEHARKIAQDETDEALGKLAEDARPPEVAVLAVPGFPAEEILGVAKDADMIVLGSRGAGGFKKLLMGSVALQVTHHAHCPVVVIPAGERSS
jgi:nucleotide-binding universal stress UspA family protein